MKPFVDILPNPNGQTEMAQTERARTESARPKSPAPVVTVYFVLNIHGPCRRFCGDQNDFLRMQRIRNCEYRQWTQSRRRHENILSRRRHDTISTKTRTYNAIASTDNLDEDTRTFCG